ncbi:hypothetical protein NDU88_000981 [Pleurodeles waltl]|uniref:Uncharacterized protein n=1 Tax=Pleurodeles waltl TaxID=8319 RepID=A0AAV7S7J4_PLEWA|nr:hypothetical protein NDU88_000981 [Pleurodeles waltl]
MVGAPTSWKRECGEAHRARTTAVKGLRPPAVFPAVAAVATVPLCNRKGKWGVLDAKNLTVKRLVLVPGFDAAVMPRYNAAVVPGFDAAVMPHFDAAVVPGLDAEVLPNSKAVAMPGSMLH